MPKPLIETLTGEPFTIQNKRITLQTQKIAGGWSYNVDQAGGQFAGIWHRPKAVVVQEGDLIQTIPIADVTRLAQIGIWGLVALLAGIFIWCNRSFKQ